MKNKQAHTYKNTFRFPAVQHTPGNRSCIFYDGDRNSSGSLLTVLITTHETGEMADEKGCKSLLAIFCLLQDPC